MKWKLLWILLVAAGLAWKIFPGFPGKASKGLTPKKDRAVAVDAAPIVTGRIALHRTFSGALESSEKFVVAPKVSGRVEELAADIGDQVRQGQVVARLDNAEFSQAVTQAEADLAVAQAGLSQARSALDIAERELRRMDTLRKRGVSSESQLDAAQSRQMAAKAGLEISLAQVTRARASLETARIRLGYTAVTADWRCADEWRVVAETFVTQGDMVPANSPLVSIVDLDPMTGIMYITEKDYGSLAVGQRAELSCDAFPGRVFAGTISRIAPVFRETTRQAQVELMVDNPDHALKPGMFVRISLVLASADAATLVPENALALRDGRTGVFLIREADHTVTWVAVVPGIRDKGQVQVSGLPDKGRVVTLGQQMLDNGSKIVIPGEANAR